MIEWGYRACQVNVSASIGPEPVSVFWGPFLFRRKWKRFQTESGGSWGAILGKHLFSRTPISFVLFSRSEASQAKTKFCCSVAASLREERGYVYEEPFGSRHEAEALESALLILLVCASRSYGQFSSNIQGTVHDQSDAVVANARVTLTNVSTQVKLTATTNQAGFVPLRQLATSRI